ncbi:MAG: pyruvate, phosphate dikinase [Spirochaetaceae bacterium]|nr:MAG: pyruvate, phosphate dikinase [Spirochaetaceae bacterium]
MKKIYSFNSKEYLSDKQALDTIGSRGVRVMELASLGAPISPGFIISNDLLDQVTEDAALAFELYKDPIAKMEQVFGKGFNDKSNPLLVKVVESPMLNMVNTLSTIHNIGLGDHTVDGFAAYVGEDFAYHEYANLIQKIAELELLTDIDKKRAARLEECRTKLKATRKKATVVKALAECRDLFPEEIFTNMHEQLLHVVRLFNTLFKKNPSSSDSCLLVQVMVFGNYGKNSGFGSFFTHDIISGENKISGDYFDSAFDARQKAGIPIDKVKPALRKELERIGAELEKHFREIRRVRFTVENGKLWVIDQDPVPNKSTQAEIKTLLDLNKAGVVDKEYVINAIKPGRLSEILHPALDLTSVQKFSNAGGGIAGAVGAAIGRVYFTTEELLKAHKRAVQENEEANFILAMPSTFAEDVKAIEVAKGVLSSEGGYASHAPVVARSLGKVALVYPKISWKKNSMKIGQKEVKEGEYITLNVPYYDPPVIYFGKASLSKPTPQGSGLLELLEIVQESIDGFDVHANADQPKDAELALMFKAQGIGLCRTEHMFFHEDRINTFRSMIIAGSREDREKALAKLEKMQVSDFYSLFKIMKGLPVTIRLLDAPLHEFLPHTADSMKEFIAYFKKSYPKVSEGEIRNRCDLLKEFNPMLGHRGIRVAISYPEIYNMQVRAIFEAAYKLQKEGTTIIPEIMIPIVMTANEIKTIRNGKRIEGKAIVGIRDLEVEVRKKVKATKALEYKVGTMIELPAAALQADRIARYADFFSFGTNDLTQTTNGLSRDDFNNFFSDYNEFDLLEENPFKVLGEQVKEMIAIAAERGKLIRPDIHMGLCGEHGAEPENIPFAKDIGLTYVSCSPYGIPIAKLAIAQMNIARAKEAKKAATA